MSSLWLLGTPSLLGLQSGSMHQICVTFTSQFPVSLRGMWPQKGRLAQQKEKLPIEAEMMTIDMLY